MNKVRGLRLLKKDLVLDTTFVPPYFDVFREVHIITKTFTYLMGYFIDKLLNKLHFIPLH